MWTDCGFFKKKWWARFPRTPSLTRFALLHKSLRSTHSLRRTPFGNSQIPINTPFACVVGHRGRGTPSTWDVCVCFLLSKWRYSSKVFTNKWAADTRTTKIGPNQSASSPSPLPFPPTSSLSLLPPPPFLLPPRPPLLLLSRNPFVAAGVVLWRGVVVAMKNFSVAQTNK